MKKNKEKVIRRSGDPQNISGITTVTKGLILMAISTFLILGARVFISYWPAEAAAILVALIGWVMVVFGTKKLKDIEPHFRIAYFTALAATAFALLQAAFGAKNVLGGLGHQSFVEIEVILFNYISVLGMLYVYRKIIQGIGSMAASKGYGLLEESGMTIWGKTAAIVLAAMFLVPMSSVLPLIPEIIVAFTFNILLILMQIYLCGEIKKAYKHVR